jgi:hypothetical protein
MSKVTTPASAQIDAHAVVGALLHDAVKAEDFEKAVKYREYRSCLDELQSAIASEQFDKCVDIKKRKSALESQLPELETKKKQMEAQLALEGSTSAELKKTISSSSSLSLPNKTAFISPLSPDAAANLAAVKERLWNTKSPDAKAAAAAAANNSQSDESDESLVKGGARATAAAQARVDKALAGSGGAKGAGGAAPAAPAKKLTAAELEARWAKIAPRAQATAKNVRGEPAADDSAVTKTKRTSWDGGFTVQAAPGAGADADDSSEEEQSRQTLDESEDVVVVDKKSSGKSTTVGDASTSTPKKKKKKAKKGTDKDKEKAAAKKKKQMQMMRSTWAVDVGGASLVELAKKKGASKTKTKKTKKKKAKVVAAPEVLVLSSKSSSASPSALKNSNVSFDGDEDTDLIQPKSAIKSAKTSSFTGGLSRAADAPDADSARKAYEQRLASARESQRAVEKDAATPEKKATGISLFGRKK